MANNLEALRMLFEKEIIPSAKGDAKAVTDAAVIWGLSAAAEAGEDNEPLIRFDISHIEYTSTVFDSPESQLTDTVFYENRSDETQQQELNRTAEIEESFTFGFVEGAEIGVTAEASIGLPDLFGAKVAISGKLSFSASQSKTFTEKESFSVKTSLTIPPKKILKASVFIQTVTTTADFTATYTASFTDSGAHILKDTTKGKSLAQLFPDAKLEVKTHGSFDGISGTALTTKAETFPLDQSVPLF